MSKAVKISVLMGAYNCADTIAMSIDSIIAQTINDWEMIICDDGSEDNTVQVIKQYIDAGYPIKLLSNEKNRGLSYSLNRCIEAADGEYCARMDGDDICDPTRFEKQAAFLDHHPEYGFVSTRMKRFDEHGVYHIPEYIDDYAPDANDFVAGSPFCHAPVMIRKNAYEKVGGYRDIEQTRGVEDYDLWFRLFANGIFGYVLQEPLYSMFDGRGAAKRRTFRRRMNEAWVRWHGYKLIHTPLYKRVFVLKPIILAFIPQWMYKLLRSM